MAWYLFSCKAVFHSYATQITLSNIVHMEEETYVSNCRFTRKLSATQTLIGMDYLLLKLLKSFGVIE